ncbi:MAG: trypsin-like peptidase domain-containing protein [Planctomycetia bacterium]|nr:trypsin-like peptidase domain-containing protein [Planctomycetia bacterium]RLT12652.1 MAG: PDZ domain-containing protein [Planctomycetota bacterium]
MKPVVHGCMLRTVLWVAIAAVLGIGTATRPGQAATPEEVIAGAARKVVKLYGAGGGRGLEAYQTGILISAEGQIVTVMSTVLDSDEIDCVLDDGRRFPATLLGMDPRRELAVLTIAGEDLPFFALNESDRVAVGTRIFALSNLFGVAVGDERVSAQHGIVSAMVPLEARRGAYEAPYQGAVYVLDCTTNNPGSPGGALIDWRGRCIGVLGKELRSNDSGIWLNYALPADEAWRGVQAIRAGETQPEIRVSPAKAFDPILLGFVLVPDLLDKTPPFIESILPGSAAAAAHLQPDDLLIAVGGKSVASRFAVQRALGVLAEGDPVRLALVRNGTIVDVDLGPRPGETQK